MGPEAEQRTAEAEQDQTFSISADKRLNVGHDRHPPSLEPAGRSLGFRSPGRRGVRRAILVLSHRWRLPFGRPAGWAKRVRGPQHDRTADQTTAQRLVPRVARFAVPRCDSRPSRSARRMRPPHALLSRRPVRGWMACQLEFAPIHLTKNMPKGPTRVGRPLHGGVSRAGPPPRSRARPRRCR